MPLNPQVRAFIEQLKAAIPANAPKPWQLTPQQAREHSERFFAPFNAGGPRMKEVRDLRVPGRRGELRARLYVPGDARAPSQGVVRAGPQEDREACGERRPHRRLFGQQGEQEQQDTKLVATRDDGEKGSSDEHAGQSLAGKTERPTGELEDWG